MDEDLRKTMAGDLLAWRWREEMAGYLLGWAYAWEALQTLQHQIQAWLAAQSRPAGEPALREVLRLLAGVDLEALDPASLEADVRLRRELLRDAARHGRPLGSGEHCNRPSPSVLTSMPLPSSNSLPIKHREVPTNHGQASFSAPL